MRSILVSATEAPGLEARLQTALDLARRHGAHVTVLFDIPASRYVAVDAFGGSYIAADALDAARAAQDAEAATLEARLAREDVPFDIVRSEDEPRAALTAAARLSDLVVLSRDGGLAGELTLQGRAPVLALNEERLASPLARACVAWDGSEPAAAALRASLPILRTCESVQVLHVCDHPDSFPATDILRYLARHDIEAELVEVMRRGSVEEALAVAVRQARADLLVMGAYGKSRLREYLFGGVTAYFLRDPAAPPLFLAH